MLDSPGPRELAEILHHGCKIKVNRNKRNNAMLLNVVSQSDFRTRVPCANSGKQRTKCD